MDKPFKSSSHFACEPTLSDFGEGERSLEVAVQELLVRQSSVEDLAVGGDDPVKRGGGPPVCPLPSPYLTYCDILLAPVESGVRPGESDALPPNCLGGEYGIGASSPILEGAEK